MTDMDSTVTTTASNNLAIIAGDWLQMSLSFSQAIFIPTTEQGSFYCAACYYGMT